VHVDEPSVDLAVATSLASSLLDRPVTGRTVVFGEIGLTGEIRGVSQAAARVAEARRLGFERAIVPADNLKSIGEVDGLRVVPVRSLDQAFVEAQIQ
jgi:DNA repair protein RadA/Sms